MKNSENGFTLIELVVALLIFSIGVMGFMKLQGETIRGNAFSQHLSTAVSLAQDKAENLVNAGLASGDLSLGNHAGATVVKNGVSYSLTWVVSALGTATNSRQVALTVTWQEKLLSHSAAISFVAAGNQVGQY